MPKPPKMIFVDGEEMSVTYASNRYKVSQRTVHRRAREFGEKLTRKQLTSLRQPGPSKIDPKEEMLKRIPGPTKWERALWGDQA